MDWEISINQKRGHRGKISYNHVEHIPRSVSKGSSSFLMDSREASHQEEREREHGMSEGDLGEEKAPCNYIYKIS